MSKENEIVYLDLSLAPQAEPEPEPEKPKGRWIKFSGTMEVGKRYRAMNMKVFGPMKDYRSGVVIHAVDDSHVWISDGTPRRGYVGYSAMASYLAGKGLYIRDYYNNKMDFEDFPNNLTIIEEWEGPWPGE